MNEVKLDTFPSNEYQALAMLYVQSQDLSNKTPEDLLDMYQDAYQRIRAHRKEQVKANSPKWMY